MRLQLCNLLRSLLLPHWRPPHPTLRKSSSPPAAAVRRKTSSESVRTLGLTGETDAACVRNLLDRNHHFLKGGEDFKQVYDRATSRDEVLWGSKIPD